MMKITKTDGGVMISGIDCFSVMQTFDCGQCFRFEVTGNKAEGYAFGKKIQIMQISDGELFISPCEPEEFNSVWIRYLSLDTDYEGIRRELSVTRKGDKSLALAMETGKGIRLLRQEPWETLCSFIISQNNNIPRIKKIIAALCKAGAEISGGSETDFPSPETLVKMGVDGLFALKTGFRAAYLYDAAHKVLSGEVDLEAVKAMPTEQAAGELCKIKGVGPKVAACALLFGFEKYDAFPIDVWVKRVMAEYYGGEVSGKDFGAYAGLAQQYLFYHRRYIEGENVK
ncbi:MAG: DNA-3-methyladenine glycosylase 2 family protein [Clostridia bacterium]|nr:DNA-3-methyladenine glycosylase 2 family protein [Clostridia bacterium]